MTVSNNYAPDVSNGNGATVIYTGNWKVFNASFFRLIYQDIATGVQTLKTLGVDYTLTFDPNSAGYSITLTAPAGVTNQVIRARQIDQTQTVPYRTSKGFQGANEENSFDKLASVDQDQQDQINRSLKFAVGSSAIGSLPVPVDQAVLAWSGTSGALFSGPTVGQIANAAANAAQTSADVVAANAAAAAAQAAAAGIKYKNSARAASTGALTATYANGAAGIGATITSTINVALPAQDGVALNVGDRFVYKDSATTFQNGVYTLTQAGSGAAPWILTRATDFDQWTEVVSAAVPVEEGAINADSILICTSNQGGTIGATAVTFTALLSTVAANSIDNTKLAQAPAGTLKSNITGATANEADNTLTAILDALMGNTRGGVITRTAAGWVLLPPSAAPGQAIVSGGTGADLAYGSAGVTYFESAETAITNNATFSVAHGLAGVPKQFQVVVRCKTADQGYSVGDEFILTNTADGGSSTAVFGGTVFANATNIGAKIQAGITVNALNLITNASWRLVAKAFR